MKKYKLIYTDEVNIHQLKFVLYVRKSGEAIDRQVQSIPDQIKETMPLSSKMDISILTTISESKSASWPDNRPEFDKMLKDIDKGKYDGIVCWHINRLSRNAEENGKIIHRLQIGKIKAIITPLHTYLPSDNSIIMALEMAISNQYVKDLSIASKRGIISKAEKGWFPNTPPLGYKSDGSEKKGYKEIITNPDKFYKVQKLFHIAARGQHSCGALVGVANKELGLTGKFGREIGKSTIYNILTNTFYYGYYEYPKDSGNIYTGKHTAMIDKKLFDQVQEALGLKAKTIQLGAVHPYKVFTCGECGAAITADNKTKTQKSGKQHFYTYYHCTKSKDDKDKGKKCHQSVVPVEILVGSIKEEIHKIQFPLPFTIWALNEIENNEYLELGMNMGLAKELDQQHASIKFKTDRLLDMRLSGDLSQEDYVTKKRDLEVQKIEISEKRENVNDKITTNRQAEEEILKFSSYSDIIFDKCSPEGRNAFLKLLGSNRILMDRKAHFHWGNLFQAMEKMNPSSIQVKERVRTAEMLINQIKTGVLTPALKQTNSQLRELDSNQQPTGYTCL